MTFFETLKEQRLDALLVGNKFVKIKPRNYEKLSYIIDRILRENLKVAIDPDCDFDGLACAWNVKRMFDKLGYTNYVVNRLYFKRHGISIEYASALYRDGFDVVFLLDSSSGDMENIQYLTDRGIYVVVIDHHETKFGFADYPVNSCVINPRIELESYVPEYKELYQVLLNWMKSDKAIFIKEWDGMNITIPRSHLIAVFREANYTNFTFGIQVDERCDAVLVLDSRDDYTNITKDVVVLEIPLDAHRETGENTSSTTPYRKVIKSTGLNPMQKIAYGELSCGALCALVCDYILNTHGIKDNIDMYIMGYITLYSDFCDLSNAYNITYLKRFRDDVINIPPLVKAFMTKWDSFDREFCSWNIAPKVNAIIRAEKFDLAHKLFYQTPTTSGELEELVENIRVIYAKAREMVELSMTDIAKYELTQVVYGIIPTHLANSLRNYTGLLAHRLTSTYNKLAIVVYQQNDSMYAGSVRDPFSRDALSLFETLCKAGGHPPAFGVKIPIRQLEYIAKYVDGFFEEGQADVIMIDWNGQPIESIRQDISLMAEYNEYGGQGLPCAYGLIRVTDRFVIRKREKSTYLFWQGLNFCAFTTCVDVGDLLAIRPVLNGSTIKLLVESIGYQN